VFNIFDLPIMAWFGLCLLLALGYYGLVIAWTYIKYYFCNIKRRLYDE
jgi:hypothetical protein